MAAWWLLSFTIGVPVSPKFRLAALAGVLIALAPAMASAAPPSAHYRFTEVKVTVGKTVHKAFAIDQITDDGSTIGEYATGSQDQGAQVFIEAPDGTVTTCRVKGYPDTLVETAAENGAMVYNAFGSRGRRSRTIYRKPNGDRQRLTFPGLNRDEPEVVGTKNAHNLVGIDYGDHGSAESFREVNGRIKPFTVAIKGATHTFVSGMNDSGTIVGSFEDRHLVGHGFIDRHGRIQVIDLPGAGPKAHRDSNIDAISDNGIWVGDTTKNNGGNGLSIGYLHRPGHGVTVLHHPRYDLGLVPIGINASGVVAGLFSADVGGAVGIVARPTAH